MWWLCIFVTATILPSYQNYTQEGSLLGCIVKDVQLKEQCSQEWTGGLNFQIFTDLWMVYTYNKYLQIRYCYRTVNLGYTTIISHSILPYSEFIVQGLISAKHQFLCPAVISVITISAKQSYTKSRDRVKIATCSDIWSWILYYRLKDTTSTRILGISLGISSHKHGTVARVDQSLRCTE